MALDIKRIFTFKNSDNFSCDFRDINIESANEILLTILVKIVFLMKFKSVENFHKNTLLKRVSK